MFNTTAQVFSPYFLNVTVDYGIKITEKGDSEEIKPCPWNRHAESYFQIRHREHLEK